jgi:MATE family multidrug resistance protein
MCWPTASRFPGNGREGLGIASAVMMWLQAIAFATYLWFTKRFAHLQLFSHFEGPRWKAIWELAAHRPADRHHRADGRRPVHRHRAADRPSGANEAAAHQIAINVAQLCFMIPMGVAEATTVRVGHAVGRGDGFGVRRAAWAGYAIIMGTQTLSAAVLLFGHDAIVGVYTNDLAVAGLASTCCCTRPPSSSRTASRCCRPARCAAEGHPRADVHRHVRVLGPGHAARRRGSAWGWAWARRACGSA